MVWRRSSELTWGHLCGPFIQRWAQAVRFVLPASLLHTDPPTKRTHVSTRLDWRQAPLTNRWPDAGGAQQHQAGGRAGHTDRPTLGYQGDALRP